MGVFRSAAAAVLTMTEGWAARAVHVRRAADGHEGEDVAQHEPADARRRRAEREPDADFVVPARDRIRHHRVETEARHRHRQQAERAGQ